MRALPEWVAKHDDQAIPDRVKKRIAGRAEYKCSQCGLECNEARKAEFDHIVALCIGGKHRETNLQLVCAPCHKTKTALDVKLRAKADRIIKKRIGIKKRSSFACSKDSPFKRKITGEIVKR